MPEQPQQPEERRSERGSYDQEHPKDKHRDDPRDRGRRGPVPPENRPGHRPERDQDKPEGPPG